MTPPTPPTLDAFRTLVAHSLGMAAQDCHAGARLVEDLDVDSLALQALLLDLEEGGYPLPAATSMVTVVTIADLHSALGNTV